MSAPSPPDRRRLRSRLFWVARWLLGGSDFHGGTVEVEIRDTRHARGGFTCIVTPQPDDEPLSPDGPPSDAPHARLAAAALAALLSADAFSIVAFVAGRGPVAAKVIAAGVAVERSKCYVLLGDLRDRGLLRDTADGYEVADGELWAAVQAARPPHSAAA